MHPDDSALLDALNNLKPIHVLDGEIAP